MRYLIILMLLLLPSVSYAEQKYNPYEDRWETAPHNSEMKYNAYENEWSYEHKNSQIEYNPYENKWEWDEDCE